MFLFRAIICYQWLVWLCGSMVDLPSLQFIVLGKTAFGSCQQFVMNNLTSLVSFDLGGNRFASVTSFAMIGWVLFDFIET